MFSRERVGTANATVGGWGNLGGGITQILVGSFLFPVLRAAYGGDSEKAWRTACILPAMLGIITAYGVIRYSDDSPKGNFSKLKKLDKMENIGIWQVFKSGAQNVNTWILFLQCAWCFGVEITMNNAAALYFGERFNLSTEKAAAVLIVVMLGSWMTLFSVILMMRLGNSKPKLTIYMEPGVLWRALHRELLLHLKATTMADDLWNVTMGGGWRKSWIAGSQWPWGEEIIGACC